MPNPIAKPSADESVNKRRLYNRRYRAKDRPYHNSAQKKWIALHRDQFNASKARYRLKTKIRSMLLYCNPICCAICGFDQLDGLVFDHINDDGAEHRKSAGISNRTKSNGTRIYEVIQKNGKDDSLQVLCANCNTIKQVRKFRRESIKDAILLTEIEEMVSRKSPDPVMNRKERIRIQSQKGLPYGV